MVIYYLFKDSLPEKYGRDALALADIMQAGKNDEGSFGAMAAIYGALPGWFLPHLSPLVGTFSLWVVLSYVRSYPLMLVLPVLLLPYILLNFLFALKETLVAIMALAIHYILKRVDKTWIVFLLILCIYVPYGIFVRQYYLIIVAVFVSIILIMKTPSTISIIYVCAGIMFVSVIPSDIYYQIQGPRDVIYHYLSTQSISIVRTCFANPLPPDNAFNFFVNTLYALIILFIPFIIGQSFNEVLLVINVMTHFGMVYCGFKYFKGAAQLPYALFVAHILTQAQFEPDLGSYVRHYSSVWVLIAPAMIYLLRPTDKSGRPQPTSLA
ncbi:MAG: hypothetical protein WBK91_03440 [Alphaproteobacteria bacterium]